MTESDALPRLRAVGVSAAIAWGIASALLFALSNVALRLVPQMGAVNNALIRGVVYGVLLVPLVAIDRVPHGNMSQRQVALSLALFTSMTLVSTVTWFVGLQALSVATATSLFALKAAFAMLGAAVLLHERIGVGRLVALCVGFAGGAILLEPSRPSLLGALWVMCAAASSALGGIFYAQLVRSRPAAGVLAISAILQCIVLAPIAIMDVANLSLQTLLIAAVSAVLSIGVMTTLAWAYRGADVGLVALLEYLRVPFAAGLAYLFFSERPTVAFYIGSAIIVGSMLLVRPTPRTDITHL